MRLFTLFLAFLSIAAAITLSRHDGTTLELRDEPMEVDLSNVIRPGRRPGPATTIFHHSDTVTTQNEGWMLLFTTDIQAQGDRVASYGCP
ncbi:hypothetical protein EJ02DRAFT_424293 [Clathrospora elynae]|uniref:Uncharacterized protein n=1 Tax=Clathrospora elynae TaxID=706981 RepID=A0A6A5SNE4_9PLEO|nr:hypothetical protein EJ02DRAFT_424293 [Clathrospora elynae]